MSLADIPEDHDSLSGVPAPAEATSVFGHGGQVGFLAKAWQSGKMHHALLFSGEQGIGKASMAFVLARHVITHPQQHLAPDSLSGASNPDLLRQIAIGAHPQVLHLTRPLDAKTGKFKTQLTIDETRRIGHFLSRTVAGNGWRVVIVDPVNDMNASAANALLKNLEEPTPRTLFILIAHAAGRLLPTIRSRCLPVRFQPLDAMDMRKALAQIGIADDDELIRLSGGSPRLAAMLSQGGGLEIIKTADSLLGNVRFDVGTALKIGEALSQREAEPLYALTCDHLLALIAGAAETAAFGHNPHAHDLAAMHTAMAAKLSEAGRFNLDKRQSILELLQAVHKVSSRPQAG